MIFGILLSFSVSFVFVKYIVKPFFRFVLSQWGAAIIEPEQIIAQIKCLTDRINSYVDEDQNPYGVINSSSFNINLTQKKTKKYQPASVREIEEGLVNIINNIYDSILMNSRFIIVLDELDKIGAVCNSAQGQCKNSIIEKAPEFIFDENGFSDEVSIHDKKRSILQLLGQMKFFTSSSKAKFVFIAGRELYDAFLADVSDREFSVSSIFNGVINIDSFFTCNSQTKDITKMTETYLCKLLIGDISVSNNEIRDAQLYSLSKYADELRKKEVIRVPILKVMNREKMRKFFDVRMKNYLHFLGSSSHILLL